MRAGPPGFTGPLHRLAVKLAGPVQAVSGRPATPCPFMVPLPLHDLPAAQSPCSARAGASARVRSPQAGVPAGRPCGPRAVEVSEELGERSGGRSEPRALQPPVGRRAPGAARGDGGSSRQTGRTVTGRGGGGASRLGQGWSPGAEERPPAPSRLAGLAGVASECTSPGSRSPSIPRLPRPRSGPASKGCRCAEDAPGCDSGVRSGHGL